MPEDYYDGQLARYEGGPGIFAFLPWPVVANTVVELQHDAFGLLPFALNDKAAVATWCRDNGFLCADWVASDRSQPPLTFDRISHLGDKLFVKARSEMAGLRTEQWERAPSGGWLWRDRQLSEQELVEWLARRASTDTNGIIIQEVLANHTEMGSCGSALSTCRIITILNEDDEPEVVEGRWRMARDPSAIVDNIYAGGVLWSCKDYETGEIALGMTKDSATEQKVAIAHHDDGRHIVGTRIPFWPELSTLAIEAHKTLNGILYVGWDVAMTNRGPVIVEMNFPSGMNPRNQMVWGGIGNSRLGEILGWRARRWLRRNRVKDASRRPGDG
ncbi:sugar-transfer associated ATP-grasp domain-containing protein [Mesorhizobium sp. 10J20-29]